MPVGLPSGLIKSTAMGGCAICSWTTRRLANTNGPTLAFSSFSKHLPEQIFACNPGQNNFVTAGEAIEQHEPVGVYQAVDPVSWADSERDLSAWLGNAMQENAAAELYRLEGPVKEWHESGDQYILEDWRKLTTSDHLYYMCTKYWADGDVHKYFSPYDSPYDAYINFMNVLDNIRRRCEGA